MKTLHSDKEETLLPGLESEEKPIIEIPTDPTPEKNPAAKETKSDNTLIWVIVITIIVIIAIFLIINLNKAKDANAN